MKRFLQMLKREESGFTLIELLVVIAILGAIAGVVILNVSGFIGSGQCEGYKTEQHNVITACFAAKVSGNGTYLNYLGTTPKYAPYTVAADCSSATGTNAPTCP
jgi:type IV pilus assembly protein PilA